ncbi:CASP2 [Mytilus coruscus]|uniref:CASP2 n=1 Tax=Mytilus coruscus TaxID=42192 RepID=A0A6J8A0M3_MYTCO|nr:CASP2 [Mytilus coruscus]
MQKEHRYSLQRNYVKLVKETPVDVVVVHLHQTGILTDELREEILQNSNSYSKTRQLISTIQRRGPQAFDGFCTELIDEGKSALVHLLKASMTETTEVSKDRAMLPMGVISLSSSVNGVIKSWFISVNTRRIRQPDMFYKKRVALNLNRWQLLEMYLNEIEDAIGQMIDDVTGVPEMTFHLGKGV